MSWYDTREPPIKHCMGRQVDVGSKHLRNRGTLDRIDGEPMWTIFPGFNTLQLSQEVKHLLLRLCETPENFTGRIIFMSMFNDISCGSNDNERECESNAQLVSLFAKRFETRIMVILWTWIRKAVWYSFSEVSPQGDWDKMSELMMMTFRESGHPVFRATSPFLEERSTSKGRRKIVNTLLCRFGNDLNCFSQQLLL